jgi:hypothetical protein
MSLSMRAILRKPENTAYLVEHYPTATLEQIADMTRRWKVTGHAIRQYAAVIGIRRDREAARTAYAEGARAAAENAIAWAPPAPDRDDEYVAACIAEGGFPVVVWINGQPRTVYRSEWAA